MEDFHLREKITHFDHERIPERVVHARGAGCPRRVRVLRHRGGDHQRRLPAGRAGHAGVHPVLHRRGLARLGRHRARRPRLRGEVLHGRGRLRSRRQQHPRVLHPGRHQVPRPHPRGEARARSSRSRRRRPRTRRSGTSCRCIPESPHMLMWAMSDRAIPRSYRMMEGFGVHTFRLVNAAGETSLVKFHWKPVLGVHGLVWDEALTLNGVDPDFHRRDLYNAIGAGAYPEWELGVQVMPDSEDQYFEGIDLLDSTKLVPEELVPVQPIGRMTLNRRPDNFFAETEQVAFHVGSPGAGHRRDRRPAAAGPAVQLPRHAAHPARRPELRADPDQPDRRPGGRQPAATGSCSRPSTTAARPTCRTASAAVARSSPAPRTAATSTCRSRSTAPRSASGARTTSTPRRPCSGTA